MKTIRESVREIAEKLPEQCTWDDVMSQIYVRQKIEDGLKAVAEGRVIDHDEVFEEYEK